MRTVCIRNNVVKGMVIIMKIKNIIATAISLCMFGNMISSYNPVWNDFSIMASAYSCEGAFGDELHWYFDGNDRLTIYGGGEMYSQSYDMAS